MPSTLWGITTFFNPVRSKTRLDNYRRFRARSRQQGLPLVSVELAFADAAFELEPEHDAEILIRKRSNAVLWQKERLLNLAVAALPAECRNVCWIDADVLFDADDWLVEVERALERCVILQPFSAAVRLPQGASEADFPAREVGGKIRVGDDEGTYSPALCARLRAFVPTFTGTTGYAWCARRELLDQVGFYDRCIVGGADREFALAFVYAPGQAPQRNIKNHYARVREHLLPWQQRVFAAVQGRYGFCTGVIHHLWHGSSKRRSYVDRHHILEQHMYDPERDIALDGEGCWTWATDKTSLITAVAEYFAARGDGG